MSTTKEIVKKAFTVRDPNYSKITNRKIIVAEEEINKLLDRNDIESTANPKNETKPLVIFIHGFAASKYCWLDPDIGNMGWVKDYYNDPEPRSYGWHGIPPPPFIIVDWTLSNQLTPKGATEYLDKKNIEWLTYSQKSAFGKIETSVKELETILSAIKKIYGDREIIIIAHSRGGLISKKYLCDNKQTPVKKLVTFGTPFGGTFLSALDTFRNPSKYFLNRVKTVKNLWDVSKERKIESISTKQMSVGSDFLKELQKKGCRDDIKYVTVAGSCSLITNIYTWRWELKSLRRQVTKAKEMNVKRKKLIKQSAPISKWYNLPEDPNTHVFHWKLIPRKMFQIYPRIGLTEVLMGDGAVSVRSALLPDENVKQFIIHRNHFDLTCCDEAYQIMLNEIKEFM